MHANQQLLDPTNGQLHFSDRFSVSPDTTLEALAGYFGNEPAANDLKSDWTRYHVRNIFAAGKYFIITFYYEQEVLRLISLSVSDQPFRMQSWDDWSEEEERRHAAEYDAWLTSQAGSAREFDWGAVSAGYDPRSGSSSVSLWYNAKIKS